VEGIALESEAGQLQHYTRSRGTGMCLFDEAEIFTQSQSIRC